MYLSKEHKKKLSDALKGRIFSEEHKKKISDAKKGKYLSKEHKKKLSDAKKGEKHNLYGKHHSEESDTLTDWDFVNEFGTTRKNYPYSIFFDEKHKKMIRDLYDNRCVVTGIIQEEHIDKYGKKLNVHHWKDSKDPFFMIPVAYNINSTCKANSENKHEWISLFNGIAEDKWCEMLENGTLEEFYEEFGYSLDTLL